MTGTREIVTSADADELARRAANWLLGQLGGGSGRLAVALSGGSTPKRLYHLLAAEPYVSRMPWPRIHWFWGDERFVPPDDERSNRRMAMEALLDHVPVPRELIHPVPVAVGSATESAAAYETTLRGFEDEARPLFDVVLLGIGPDGHTASLFPGMPALSVEDRLAIDTPPGMEPLVPRVTLTFPAIASSLDVAVLVSGADKRDALRHALSGGDIPAGRISSQGRVMWFVDEAAMG
jgi:6-phosphogluconolactonase